jgi:hypothetical protein
MKIEELNLNHKTSLIKFPRFSLYYRETGIIRILIGVKIDEAVAFR